MPRKKDTLFRTPYPPARFEFNEPVARVFEDMLTRSVPLYKECLELTVAVAKRFARPRSRVVDLGCSTGTLLQHLADTLPKSVRLVGLDQSPAMLKKARRKMGRHLARCELVQADLNGDFDLTGARVILMNYTLQFIAPNKRGALLRRLHTGLVPGGALVLIEKVAAATPELDALFIAEHHRFKRKRGYSRLEIAQKRQALERVLHPLTGGENERLLKQAGFSVVEPFFRWCNFAGWVAVKTAPKAGKT